MHKCKVWGQGFKENCGFEPGVTEKLRQHQRGGCGDGDKEITDCDREDERTWRSGCGDEQAPRDGGAACRETTGFESYSLHRLCFRILP